MTNNTEQELLKVSEAFWQFHNDRLANPNLTDMTPYLNVVEAYLNATLTKIEDELPEPDNRPNLTGYGEGFANGEKAVVDFVKSLLTKYRGKS